MEIGGRDTIIKTTLPPAWQRAKIVSLYRETWPEAVFEEDDRADGVFIYQDAAYKGIADTCGILPAHQHHFVHVIFADGQTTITD